MSAELKPDAHLDCKGLLCPLPVVKTKRSLKKMEVGQILEMLATDPGAVPDMEAWERQTRHKIHLAEELPDEVFRFLIEKTH